MKIKIIDLFNMSSKKEKMPEKIKYDLKEYFYCGYDYKICDVEKQFDDDYNLWNNLDMYKLNDYVEIIEEPKKIEKLDVALLGQCDNWLRCPTNKVTKQDVELNPYIIDNIRENTLYFQRKINDLIDEINNLKEK